MIEKRFVLKKEVRSYWRLIILRRLFRFGRWAHRLFNLKQARLYFKLVGHFFSWWEKGASKKIMINGLEAEIFGQSLDKARRLIFYLHGGAFVSGSSLTHRHLVLRLAKEAVASALVINYRLAPEFPFPAPLEDCFRAYRWLLEKEYQSARLAIAGDSAGGNLAVALTQKLIKEGYPLPACLILFSPWVDLSCSSPSYEERSRRDPMISRPLALERAKWYAGSKTLNNPEISPLFGDFTNFPPLLIFIGSEEVLYDEALALAQKAIAAGVEVQLLEWRGMFHVWPYFFPFLPEGREACRLAGDFLRLYLSKN